MLVPTVTTRPGHKLSQAPVPARVSAGRSSPGLAISAGHHLGWRVSAPKLPMLLFACTATTKARHLTPRSSGAPTASHQAQSGGTRYIFANPGLASCRRRPLSSNVRHREPNVRFRLPGLTLRPASATATRSPRHQRKLAVAQNQSIGFSLVGIGAASSGILAMSEA